MDKLPTDKLKAHRVANWLLAGAILVNLYFIGVKLGWFHAAGCGLESGCQSVLQSDFSMLFGIPVSFFAIPIYIAGIIIIRSKAPFIEGTRIRWIALLLGVASGGALWFFYIQGFVLNSFCPYCLGSHLLGIGGFATAFLSMRTTPSKSNDFLYMGLGGIASVLILMVQLISGPTDGPPILALDDPPQWTHYDGVIKMATSAEDLESNPKRIQCLFDYTCDHCRALQRVLMETIETGELDNLILVPVPMHQDCNPLFRKSGKKAEGVHTYACDLAQLAMELWHSDPSLFWQFHWGLIQQERLTQSDWTTHYIEHFQGITKTVDSRTKASIAQQSNRNTALFETHYLEYKRSLLPQLKIGNRVIFGEVRKTKLQAILSDLDP